MFDSLLSFFLLFDLRSAFNFVLHTLLPPRLSSFQLPGAYVKCFRSYLTNRQSHVHVSGTISSPTEVLSRVPQGSVLWPLRFSVFINDLRDAINYPIYIHPIFSDDIKIYRAINYT
jgi:hypothetical protein